MKIRLLDRWIFLCEKKIRNIPELYCIFYCSLAKKVTIFRPSCSSSPKFVQKEGKKIFWLFYTWLLLTNFFYCLHEKSFYIHFGVLNILKKSNHDDGLSKSNWIVDFDISKIDFSRFTLGSGNRWKGLFRKLLSALVVVETVGKRKEHVTKYHSMAWSIPSEFRQEKGEGAIKADRTIWGDFDAWESLFASELWQTTTETRVEMWWNLLLTVSELLCHHPQALWGHYKLQGLRPQQHCHQPLQQSAPRNNVMGILVCFAMFWNGIQKVSLFSRENEV